MNSAPGLKVEAPKVLVVDDEEDIVAYLVTVLEDHGYRAAGEHDVAAARAAIQRERPDLILLDIMMPGKSGLSLYQEIRRHEETSPIPVFIMTGHSGEEDFAALMGKLWPEMPCLPEGYLEKPISVPTLLQKLHTLFKRERGGCG